jgi:hypothetical protein
MDADELGQSRPLGSRPRGIPIGWGHQVVLDALEGEDVLLDFEVPDAAEWLEICGEGFGNG